MVELQPLGEKKEGGVCVCVCVCERERERERGKLIYVPKFCSVTEASGKQFSGSKSTV